MLNVALLRRRFRCHECHFAFQFFASIMHLQVTSNLHLQAGPRLVDRLSNPKERRRPVLGFPHTTTSPGTEE